MQKTALYFLTHPAAGRKVGELLKKTHTCHA